MINKYCSDHFFKSNLRKKMKFLFFPCPANLDQLCTTISAKLKLSIETKLLVSGRSPDCSECLLRSMEQ